MGKERQRITVDLEELFPGEIFEIGSQKLIIAPLQAGQIADIFKKVKVLVKSLKDDGVDFQNYQDPDNMLKLSTVILEQSPELLEECSNIAVEDIRKLPIEKIVELLTVIIAANLKAKESLLGNLASLAGIFKKADQMDQKIVPEKNQQKIVE